VKKGQLLGEIRSFSIVTQRILVGSHIWDRDEIERQELHNPLTDHVLIRSEPKYLIEGKVVKLKCGVFPMVRPVATVRFRVEPQPEPTLEFGPVVTLGSLHRQNILRHSNSQIVKLIIIRESTRFGLVIELIGK